MRINSISVITVVALCASLAGCALLSPCAPYCNTVTHNSSSLVQFLYPNGVEPPADNQIPELHVPLRIGLAFLPQSGPGGNGPTAAQREALLERIQEHFSHRHFVAQIVLIPDYYLTGARGFEGLQGVQRLYDVDLMALVSYDQVMHQDLTAWSLAYWTIAGAYVIKGNRYDVATLVDLAVVDPATRSLVLRAGGTDTGHGNATMIAESRALRASSDAGFTAATKQMIGHFDAALDQFQAQVRAGKARVRVVSRSESAGGGAGSLGWIDLLLLVPLALVRLRRAALRCEGS
ncbi:MAG TPA: rhombotarget lipoprotein [Steroidobacteraceae bacterium]|jgi:rhombotail lipoprotein